ncbi:MAG: HupE/UreJ family protein [Pseudomonadota bacterium]
MIPTPRPRSRQSLCRLALLFALLFAFAPAARAHFEPGANLRTIILAEEDGSLVAYVRSPAPLFFGDVVRTARAEATPLATPFLYFELTGAGARYRLSLDAIAEEPERFEARLARTFAWSEGGPPIAARVLDYRLRQRDPDSSFSTAAEAQAALRAPGARLDPVFGAAVVELRLALDVRDPAAPLTLAAGLPALPLPEGVRIANRVLDARSALAISQIAPGQLQTAVVLGHGWLDTVLEFTWQGALHIIQGLDHVLLVVALALGLGWSLRLIWHVTAFTVGHSVTLIATFLGAAPAWPWFIPAVEAAIAATVLLAALAALLDRMGSVWITGAVGLLHGLGFSFVLGEILGRDAPELIPALAAFNLGIELGQLAIIAVTLAAVAALTRLGQARPVRRVALVGIAAVAALWMVERSATLL